MHASSQCCSQSGSGSGPAVYYGYCQRSRQYRMMNLSDYMSSMQEGMSRLMNDTASAYQQMFRNPGDMGGTTAPARHGRDCGCHSRQRCDCHCECCVCDADVLVHARCGEIRRIPLTFENDTRRERPVKLELGKFVSAGGKDLGWGAQLSETEFTLRSCDEHTVILTVGVRCETKANEAAPAQPATPTPAEKNAAPAGTTGSTASTAAPATGERINVIVNERFGSVDRCEVGYATIRAEGCLTRPVVVAVAVLPDDCDAYRHPCGCGCCH